MTFRCFIDFADPQDLHAPRLRRAFGAPLKVLVAQALADVRAVLDAVEAAALQGRWCVGYLRYEAAPAFDPALVVHAPDGPLAWFAVYETAKAWPEPSPEVAAQARVEWRETCPRSAFDTSLSQIQRAIAAGELYQVNFTAPLAGAWVGEPTPERSAALFAALQRAQPGGYAAWLDTGDAQVLSVSPELFFDWQDGQILARPMKGTAARGSTAADDAAHAEALRTSPKERAENVMIVDLLRNDLSRIAEPFSVEVPRLFHAEALPTVWQMTSDVRARTRAGTTLADVFGALFPCGSVTGAPKVRAMQMIRALEPVPRGVYCGAVGVVRPGESGAGIRATFNVPIRTVIAEGDALACGIGSGITFSSDADAEWQEWQQKRAFVERASQPFELLETLALDDGALRNVEDHLQRLAGAAAHFAFDRPTGQAACVAAAEEALRQVGQAHPQGRWRVRLLLNAGGSARAEAFAMEPPPSIVRLQLATAPLEEAHGEFVRFKTTHRRHYDAFTPSTAGVFDTVLWNVEGEITESTRGNVAMRIDGRWVTPPLACGLLPGIGRALALREGRVVEAVVRVTDVPRVQEWAFLNSLRGWIPAELTDAYGTAVPPA